MDAAEGLQQAVVKALHAEGKPIHAAVSQHSELLPIDSARIGLDGEFLHPSEIDTARQRLQQRSQLVRRKRRWRAAADEDRLRMLPASAQAQAHLGAERVQILRLLSTVTPREGEKIAVGAFLITKGNMNVKSDHINLLRKKPLCETAVRCHYSSSRLSTAMKASCGISTLPTCFMRFFPSFCFSRSLRLRLMSPP